MLILFLLCAINIAAGDDCEPGIADSCFEAVTKDLQYMIDLRKMQAINITSYAVNELCLALDDSLNCTSDIIDTDCTEFDGKDVFDSWLLAFRGAYHYVCDGVDHKGLRDILQGTSCWSIEDFILCAEEKTGLTDIKHILHSDQDDIECHELHKVVSKCREDAKVGSCREQDFVFQAVDGMIKAFFEASRCEGTRSTMTANGNEIRPPFSTVLSIVLQIIVITLVL